MPVLIAILVLLAALVAVVLARTASFKPKASPYAPTESEEFDKEKAVSNLQQLIRCKTISYYDKNLEDDAEFKKLIDLLPELYPNVFNTCTYAELPDRALLFCLQGEKHDAPAVLMAHYDVVPVDEEGWVKPPFEAIIENGVLWGRGSLDTKITFNAVLTAADNLIAKGFKPQNDIYFAFSGGEEVAGMGAVNIVKWFRDNGITPALVVDEGGAVVDNVFPGVSEPCGLIGIAEKGMMNATFTLKSAGGHASAPPPHTPIGLLADACCKIEAEPFPMYITKPVAEMFDTLGRHSSFVYRMIFANLWLFKGVLNMLCKKSGGELNALLRTTVALTQASGSIAPNVIPPSASVTANLRLNPMDTVDSAKARLQQVIKNNDIEVTVGGGMNPSPISETNCDAWNRVASSVADTWPGCIVSPYIMIQCSDSRHYGEISNHVYRFSAMALTKEERGTIHGHNERCRVENIEKSVELYTRLMKQC